MIIRIIAVDPNPRNGEDLLVYQVPENSRAEELLFQLFEANSIEFVRLASTRVPKQQKKRGA